MRLMAARRTTLEKNKDGRESNRRADLPSGIWGVLVSTTYLTAK